MMLCQVVLGIGGSRPMKGHTVHGAGVVAVGVPSSHSWAETTVPVWTRRLRQVLGLTPALGPVAGMENGQQGA